MNKKQRLSKYIPTLRIPSVTKLSLMKSLIPIFHKLNSGVVLDVGSGKSPYKNHVAHSKYVRLDMDPTNKPDICCSLSDIKSADKKFDTVIATEVLEHIEDPEKAVSEIHRVLKPGGICILSTRFMFYYHPDPKDYFRFSRDGLAHLFRNFNKVRIISHGNGVQVFWQMLSIGKLSIILNLLNPVVALINYKSKRHPSGFIVYATR